MIVKNQVPEQLYNKRVFSVDLPGMLAGTRYRGDFEEKLKKLLETVMDDGDIVMQGTPREVFSNVELLHRIGLEAPAMGELAYLLRKEGLDVPADRLDVSECADALEKLFKGQN